MRLAWLRRIILSLFKPMARRIGHIYIAFHRPGMTLEDADEIFALAEPGDVVLCRSKGEFTNHFISGFWTHAAMITGKDVLSEAVSPCVVSRRATKFFLEKDFVCVLRPKFANQSQREHAVAYVNRQVASKIPYDYLFSSNSDAFYCSELVGEAYVEAMGGASPFTPRFAMGVLTYLPSDFYNAINKFELIWCKNDVRIPERNCGDLCEMKGA